MKNFKTNLKVIYNIVSESPHFQLIGIIIYFISGFYFLKEYIIWDATTFAGLATLVFIYFNKIETKSLNFAFLSIPLVCLSLLIKVNTVFYFAFMFSFFYFLQKPDKKQSILAAMVVFIISPAFRYFMAVISFPIRLTLTQFAGSILQMIKPALKMAGNTLSVNGEEFSVDPTCLGLNMLQISLITGIIIILLLQKQKNKEFNIIGLIILCISIVCLNIICNLIRIIVLIHFRIFPDNSMHEIIGLICLFIYVFIPYMYFTKILISNRLCIIQENRFRIPEGNFYHLQHKSLLNSKWFNIKVLHILILIVLIISGLRIKKSNIYNSNNTFIINELRGFKQETIKNGIKKYEKDGILVYIKPIKEFYSADHNPTICWIGGGYKFKNISTFNVNEKEIYKGIMEKNNEKIFTAWWFDNGDCQTISQFDWRWRLVKGEKPFYLVNVNCENKNDFIETIIRMIKK